MNFRGVRAMEDPTKILVGFGPPGPSRIGAYVCDNEIRLM